MECRYLIPIILDLISNHLIRNTQRHSTKISTTFAQENIWLCEYGEFYAAYLCDIAISIHYIVIADYITFSLESLDRISPATPAMLIVGALPILMQTSYIVEEI